MQERKILISRSGMVMLIIAMMVVVAFFIATCGVAMADEVPPPDAIPLLKGQVAPFSGVLLPSKILEDLLKAKADAERLNAELKAAQKELDLTVRLYENQIRKLTAELDPGFWRQAETQRWIGFSLGIIFTSGAVWGAGQLE